MLELMDVVVRLWILSGLRAEEKCQVDEGAEEAALKVRLIEVINPGAGDRVIESLEGLAEKGRTKETDALADLVEKAILGNLLGIIYRVFAKLGIPSNSPETFFYTLDELREGDGGEVMDFLAKASPDSAAMAKHAADRLFTLFKPQRLIAVIKDGWTDISQLQG